MVKLPSIMKGWFNPVMTPEQIMRKLSVQYEQGLVLELVQQFNNDLYHYLLSQSDRHLAEDICQSTWLKIIDKRHLFSHSQSFKSWLFTLARNLLIDELRRQHRWQFEPLDNLELSITLDIEQLLLNTSLQQRFDFLIKQLPFSQKEAFILQQEGFSLQEIAQISHTSSETIKSRLRYARRYFKRYLEQEHEG